MTGMFLNVPVCVVSPGRASRPLSHPPEAGGGGKVWRLQPEDSWREDSVRGGENHNFPNNLHTTNLA